MHKPYISHAQSELPFLRKWKNKRILVTGASGHLGAFLVSILAGLSQNNGLGNHILAAGRNTSKLVQLSEAFPGIEPCAFDIQKPLPNLGHLDYILHAAGPVGPAIFKASPSDVIMANVTGTGNLLEYAKQTMCDGFVFASTHEVYGNVYNKQTVTESDAGALEPMQARACYGQGKRAAETLLASYQSQYGLRAMSTRLSRFYGPGMNLRSGLFICDFIENGIAGEDIELRGDASLLRPLTHTYDVATAMLTVLDKGTGGCAYNVQANQCLTIGQIAEQVASLCNVSVILKQPETKYRAPNGQLLSTERIQSLGWNASIPFNTGLSETIHFHQKEKTKW